MAACGDDAGGHAEAACATGAFLGRPFGSRMLKTADAESRLRRHASSRSSPNRPRNSSCFSPRLGARNPWQRHTVRSRVSGAGTDSGMRGAGIWDVAWPCGKDSTERAAGPRIPIGERSPTCRCHGPRPATVPPVQAGFTACRPRMNVPATGIIPAGPGSLRRRGGERRRQGEGSFAEAAADKRRRSVPLEDASGWKRTACQLIPQRIP